MTKELRPMLTAEQVLEIIPMSRKTLQRLEARGLFPAGHVLAVGRLNRKKFYYEDEVADFQRRMEKGLLRA
jgi:prophage regulatory protein